MNKKHDDDFIIGIRVELYCENYSHKEHQI